MAEKVLVSVLEAAEMLSIGRTTAWQLVWSGELPSAKLGQRRLVPVSAIREYAERMVAV